MRAICLSLVAVALSCGGSSNNTGKTSGTTNAVAEAKQVHPCGTADKTHQYDLHDEDGDDALVPCSKSGGKDFSVVFNIE